MYSATPQAKFAAHGMEPFPQNCPEEAAFTTTAPESISWLMPLSPEEDPDLLRQTLLSLQGQTLQAAELLIAADGSLPAGLEAVIEACPLAWRVQPQAESLGIGATLKAAAIQCQGTIILRIDSDDLYAPAHTATIVKALERYPHAGVIGCQLLEFDSEEGVISARRTPTDPQLTRRWLPWRNPMNHQTVGLRREALLSAGGYRDAPGFEDWDLWLRIEHKGYDLINLPGCTVAARVNKQHRRRRHGWDYVRREVNFYRKQVDEGQIQAPAMLAGLLTRLPWRLAPSPILGWWMSSGWRSSPPLDAAWLSELLAECPGEPSTRHQQDR